MDYFAPNDIADIDPYTLSSVKLTRSNSIGLPHYVLSKYRSFKDTDGEIDCDDLIRHLDKYYHPHEPSLYFPYISEHLSKSQLQFELELIGLGDIHSIHMGRTRMNSVGIPYRSATIHFKDWNTTDTAIITRAVLLYMSRHPHKSESITLPTSQQHFIKAIPYTPSHTSSNSSSRRGYRKYTSYKHK